MSQQKAEDTWGGRSVDVTRHLWELLDIFVALHTPNIRLC
jgi:hypothetical protein